MAELSTLGRENLWTISSPIGGTTVTANYVLGTASGNCLAGVLNPLNVPKAAFIKRAVITVVTGTMVTGAFVWGVMTSANVATITSTGTEPLNMWTYAKATGVHTTKAFAGDTTASVLAASTAAAVVLLRPFGGGVAGAVSAGAPYTLEETPDEMSVAPGTFVGLFPAASGSSMIVLAAITYAEGE